LPLLFYRCFLQFMVWLDQCNMKNTEAFSIIELSIVVAIIGIVSTASILSYAPLKNSWEINGFKKQVVNDLKETRESSVTEQLRHELRFIPPNQPTTYSLVKINPDETENVLWTKAIPLSLNTNLLYDSQKIIFSLDGSSLANQIILTGKSNSITKKITINPVGNIKEE
jgi:prepilin-type N-terminal cleavage/methylation domain-containing protein